MLKVDSLGQIEVGLSERVRIIRFSKVSDKQYTFPQNFLGPNMIIEISL